MDMCICSYEHVHTPKRERQGAQKAHFITDIVQKWHKSLPFISNKPDVSHRSIPSTGSLRKRDSLGGSYIFNCTRCLSFVSCCCDNFTKHPGKCNLRDEGFLWLAVSGYTVHHCEKVEAAGQIASIRSRAESNEFIHAH